MAQVSRDPSGEVPGTAPSDPPSAPGAFDLLEVFEGADEGYWHYDVASGRLWLSSRVAAFLGRDPFPLQLDVPSWVQRIHEDDVTLVSEGVALHLGGARDRVDMEYRVRREDGTWLWLSSRGKTVATSDDGLPTRIAGTMADISDRKHAEASLRAIEARFKLAFEESPDPITITRLSDGLYVDVNAGSAALFRCTREEMVGRTSHDVGIWADPRDRERLLAAVAASGRVMNFEATLRRQDGSQFTGLLTTGVVLLDGVPHLLTHYRDITESKRTQEQLRESHELLVNLARLVPGVIYQYRLYADGRSAFPYSSPGMNDIYEVSPEDVREDATPVFGRLHPDDAAYVSEAIYESARTLDTFHCQFRVILPRQGLRWRWSQAHPVRMPDGGTLWHGIILDITDRVQGEAEKAALEAELQQAQKMESVGRLAGGVAHDFNNMLGVILGHTELMLGQAAPGSLFHESLLEVRDAANRSADLTRQLLAFARRQPVTPKVLDLNETISSLVAMLQRLIGEDIRLDWQPRADVWHVKLDPSQVDQLLVNLCVNARDAISGAGRVSIRLENISIGPSATEQRPDLLPGDYVRIVVSDTGSGMDANTLAHLFEPFFTTKAFGKGTGVGLATVYGVVRQNRGYVEVDSAVNRGTTIAVHFPRHVGPDAPVDDARSLAVISRGHETVLVAEDETSVLDMARLVLERLGYKVLTAHTAADALVLADQHPDVSLLITDVVMPDLNGRDLARRLSAEHPNVKLMFMSGYTADVIAQQGVLAEGIAFIQKPFSIDTLAAAVREVLDRG